MEERIRLLHRSKGILRDDLTIEEVTLSFQKLYVSTKKEVMLFKESTLLTNFELIGRVNQMKESSRSIKWIVCLLVEQLVTTVQEILTASPY